MSRYEFEKRTIGPMWTEYKIVVMRPSTDDYHVFDDDAKKRFYELAVVTTAAIVTMNLPDMPALPKMLIDMLDKYMAR